MKTKRNGIVDLYRFLAIFVVMDNHIGMAGGTTFFVGGYYVIEFFFFLTGFLTCRHYDLLDAKIPNRTVSEKSKDALLYTYNKFKGFMPLVFIIVIAQYILTFINCYEGFPGWKELLGIFNDMPNEMLLLKSSYGTTLVGPLWYLSSMFIAFPLVCFLIQVLDKYTFIIFAFLTSLLYLGKVGVDDYFYYPQCLPRAFFDLLIGAIIYYAGSLVVNKYYDKVHTAFLAAVEVLLLMSTFVFYREGWDYANHIVLWIVIVAVSIGMSPKLSSIGAGWMTWLGKLSMPLFLIHWFIVTFIGYYYSESVAWTEASLRVVFFGVSIAVSIVYMIVSDLVKRKIAK